MTYVTIKGNKKECKINYYDGIFSGCLSWDSRVDWGKDEEGNYVKDILHDLEYSRRNHIKPNYKDKEAYENRLGNYEDFTYEQWVSYWEKWEFIYKYISLHEDPIDETKVGMFDSLFGNDMDKEAEFIAKVKELANEYGLTLHEEAFKDLL